VSTVTVPTTAEQLFYMRDDGFRYELVKGEIRKMTPSGYRHGKLIVNLTIPLGAFVKANLLGVVLGAETGFKIASSPDTVLAPDIAFVHQKRIIESGETDKFWPGAPDLAVEVLSPGDTVYELDEKVAAWLAGGTSMVWVINPKQRSLHVHRPNTSILVLSETDILDGQNFVPGFRIEVSEIFA